MAVVDLNQILRTHLRTEDTELFTLCGTRIFPPPGLPHDLTVDEAVSFSIVPPGGPHTPAPVETSMVEAMCWAGRGDLSWDVASALDAVLHNIGPTVITIGDNTFLIAVAVREDTPQGPLKDPSSDDWWFTLVHYGIVWRTEART